MISRMRILGEPVIAGANVSDHRGTQGYKPRYRREENRPYPHRSGDVSRRCLADHLVRLEQQYRRDLQAQCPGGLEIDGESKARRLLERQINGLSAFENPIHEGRYTA